MSLSLDTSLCSSWLVPFDQINKPQPQGSLRAQDAPPWASQPLPNACTDQSIKGMISPILTMATHFQASWALEAGLAYR